MRFWKISTSTTSGSVTTIAAAMISAIGSCSAQRAAEVRDHHRHRLGVRVGDGEVQREQVLVPRGHKGKQAGRDQRGRRQWQQDQAKGLQRRGTIDEGGLFDLARKPPEKAR